MPRKLALFLAPVVLFVAICAHAATFNGKVVRVLDGDTIEVLRNGRAEKIRLAGIDCPERGQDFGQAAKRFTLDLAAQKVVTVQVETRDRYGRLVAEILLPDGKSLNQELVRVGYAWWYRQYSTSAILEALEAEARSARRGLWSAPSPVPPWEWRRGRRKSAGLIVAPQATMRGECGEKRLCSQLTSCAEAVFFLEECGVSSLDRDGDGLPCEALCK